jgi:hemerythrin-like domain-containing protein
MDRTDSQDDSSYEKTVAREHRRLDALFETLLAALRRGDGHAIGARDAFAELRNALESHIDQEDRLYYPALRALRPVHRPLITDLVDAHVLFRSRLEALEARLSSTSSNALPEAERAAADFAAAFGAHEASEEAMLRSIDAELARASSGPRS